MTNLQGTVAVVTGGGRGIGREIALHEGRGGAKGRFSREPHAKLRRRRA